MLRCNPAKWIKVDSTRGQGLGIEDPYCYIQSEASRLSAIVGLFAIRYLQCRFYRAHLILGSLLTMLLEASSMPGNPYETYANLHTNIGIDMLRPYDLRFFDKFLG